MNATSGADLSQTHFAGTLAQSTDSKGDEWTSREDSVWGPSEQAQHPATSTELGFAHSGDHTQQGGPEMRAKTVVCLCSSFSLSDTEGDAPTPAGSRGSSITGAHVAPSLRCPFLCLQPLMLLLVLQKLRSVERAFCSGRRCRYPTQGAWSCALALGPSCFTKPHDVRTDACCPVNTPSDVLFLRWCTMSPRSPRRGYPGGHQAAVLRGATGTHVQQQDRRVTLWAHAAPDQVGPGAQGWLPQPTFHSGDEGPHACPHLASSSWRQVTVGSGLSAQRSPAGIRSVPVPMARVPGGQSRGTTSPRPFHSPLLTSLVSHCGGFTSAG